MNNVTIGSDAIRNIGNGVRPQFSYGRQSQPLGDAPRGPRSSDHDSTETEFTLLRSPRLAMACSDDATQPSDETWTGRSHGLMVDGLRRSVPGVLFALAA